MKRYRSLQPPARFVRFTSPMVLDRSAEWGPGSVQSFPNGAFLRLRSNDEVSHGIQPNEDFSAPVGWEPTAKRGLFRKKDISAERIEGSGSIVITTLDGPVSCPLPCYLCANLNYHGEPDPHDRWPRPVAEFEAAYQPC